MSGQKNAKSVKKCQNLKNYLTLFFFVYIWKCGINGRYVRYDEKIQNCVLI